jgi:PAS domain S-box-containing protein
MRLFIQAVLMQIGIRTAAKGAIMHHTNETRPDDSELSLSEDIQNILESSYDGIWITDGKGKVLYVNSANERLLGIRREEVLGRYCGSLHEDKLFSKSATLQVIENKKRVTMMGFNYRTNKDVLITGNPIFARDGSIKFIVNNVRDTSQIANMMNELKKRETLISEQQTEIQHLLSIRKAQKGEEKVVFVSKAMQRAMELAQRVSRFNSTVLILGESGVGKEVIAKNIVSMSERSDKPFIKVNCGAIPETLIESELFGYERGAFSGASQKGRMGMFELANNGTILLDEVAELPLNLQVKLLRVLQEKEIYRVGGEKPIKLNVRVLAATNRDLDSMVGAGLFRKDLYYRLNVVTITVPPLRERPEDVPVVAQYFLQQLNEKYDVKRVFSPQVVRLFAQYKWPGNIRELQNVVENLVVMANGAVIDADTLPERIKEEHSERPALQEGQDELPYSEALLRFERDYLRRAMQKYKTTRAAAKALGIDQSTVVRKLNKCGISEEL